MLETHDEIDLLLMNNYVNYLFFNVLLIINSHYSYLVV